MIFTWPAGSCSWFASGRVRCWSWTKRSPMGLIQTGAASVTLSNAGGVLYCTRRATLGVRSLCAFGRHCCDLWVRRLDPSGCRMVFVADSGDPEPHVAEGFAASQLRDVFPGPQGSIFLAALVSHDGWVYFMANDGVLGFELWRTDGTTAGTALFADIEPGSASSFALLSSPLGLFFSANGSGLWATDGAAVTRVDNLQRSSSDPRELLHDPIASRLFMTIFSEGFGRTVGFGWDSSRKLPPARYSSR